MSKSKKKAKVTSLDAKRRKHRKEKAAKEGYAIEHWYELIAYFDPAKIETIDLPQTQGYRSFIHGTIDNYAIIQVPSNMPAAQIKGLGTALGKMNFKTLIVSDNVKFMKLRPCSEEESELLDEADSEKKGSIFVPTGDGARPKPDSIGGGGGEAEEPTASPSGSDQDDSEDADGRASRGRS